MTIASCRVIDDAQARRHNGSPRRAPERHGLAGIPGGKLSNAEVADIHGRYRLRLLGRARGILRDAAAADDALQDLFVKVLRHGDAYRVADDKLGWLCRVLDNCCFDVHRRRRKPSLPVDELAQADVVIDPHETPVARIAVSRALARLSRRERYVVVRFLCDGASQRQIAEEVGWSRQTVNAKLKTIHRRLARWLDGTAAPWKRRFVTPT